MGFKRYPYPLTVPGWGASRISMANTNLKWFSYIPNCDLQKSQENMFQLYFLIQLRQEHCILIKRSIHKDIRMTYIRICILSSEHRNIQSQKCDAIAWTQDPTHAESIAASLSCTPIPRKKTLKRLCSETHGPL